jgi:hypothetical protein
MLNLGMAVCWLILGAALLAYQWSDPAGRSLSIWGTRVSLGWFAVAMALYNLFRWFLGRLYRKVPQSKLEPSRGQDSNAERTQGVPTHDPRFNFTRDRPGDDEL